MGEGRKERKGRGTCTSVGAGEEKKERQKEENGERNKEDEEAVGVQGRSEGGAIGRCVQVVAGVQGENPTPIETGVVEKRSGEEVVAARSSATIITRTGSVGSIQRRWRNLRRGEKD
ncbi:hypothetical protein CKAN_00244000 [Cinnamomum micranthum f. kanehirae]|uniref:Uncharacterized protein n=1 Tax=Cinnamomum micranthum f. kanehirae TaxID=337451 RepID=A0A3S3PWF3_9MAGN|nr:hypothetical protein CKAN_00244000 [Cinnamomum micranthum f. kanehirae]